jgi:hypothetical protein
MVIINNKPENLGYIGIISFTNVLYKLGIPERVIICPGVSAMRRWLWKITILNLGKLTMSMAILNSKL